MGQALLGGILAADQYSPADVTVVEVMAEQQAVLTEMFPGVTVSDTPVEGVDTIVAVKPYLVDQVCRELVNPGRVMSVAAGVTIAAIEAAVPSAAVIRVMPNTPALVGAGISGVAAGSGASDDDLDWAVSILSAVGRTVVVTESQLDAVTGVSGSGPAYIFLVAEAMIDAGVRVGLTRAVASELAINTIFGAGKMMLESGDAPVDLRAAVTTPAGTTAAGLAALETHGLRAAFLDAVAAATDRSIEIGR